MKEEAYKIWNYIVMYFLILNKIRFIKDYVIVALISLTITILPGCYPGYQSIHEQGNVLNPADISQLQIGMTRREVQNLLGTPAVKDPFHKYRWDYIYDYRASPEGASLRILSLFFDNEILVKIEHKPSISENNSS